MYAKAQEFTCNAPSTRPVIIEASPFEVCLFGSIAKRSIPFLFASAGVHPHTFTLPCAANKQHVADSDILLFVVALEDPGAYAHAAVGVPHSILLLLVVQ